MSTNAFFPFRFVDYAEDPDTGALHRLDLTSRIQYGKEYLDRYKDYPEERLSSLRLHFLQHALKRVDGVTSLSLLDFGCGTGAFVRHCLNYVEGSSNKQKRAKRGESVRQKRAKRGEDILFSRVDGCDIVKNYPKRGFNPVDLESVLQGDDEELYYDVVTFYDTLEHLSNPVHVLKRVQCRFIVVSVPCCHYPKDEEWLSEWRHIRPDEHLWHFNRESLLRTLLKAYPLGAELAYSFYEDRVRLPANEFETNILTIAFECESDRVRCEL